MFFWYKKHLLIFRSVQRENRFFPKEEISVSCIGRSSKVLKDLLSECRTKYLASVQNKTSIFKHHNGDWNKSSAVDIRQPDTVIVNEEKKTALLEDIKCFLESQAWYSVRSIPHRKGYLLYGPPGTGKSSLSLLIAGECDLDIYILNLSSVNDDSLDELFNTLPARCIVLLEDIDAVNATHSRQHRTVTSGQDNTTSLAKKKPDGRVSLSALLNAIDGVGSQEGRLLIMTTNHVERLDAALLRPGRVDMKLELGLTTHEINARLFLSIFRSNVSDEKERAEDVEVLRPKKLEVKETELKKLAADFATKVPEYEFSPAEIQMFLLGYRKSPAMAVQNVQEWVVKTREEKGHIKRADFLVSEGSDIDDDITPSDKSAAFATAQDDTQAREKASTTVTTADSHCCSCQVLDDIMAIWGREEMPSVNYPLPVGKSGPVYCIQVEQSLLFNHLSDLEAYRDTHGDRAHSTLGLVTLLLDFVRKTYRSSPGPHSTLLDASPNCPGLPLCTASDELLTLSQPATKIVQHFESKLGEVHCSGGDTTVSDAKNFWDEAGWEPVVFDQDNAEPDAAFSETSPEDASSGTSFESGSEMSCEVDGIVEQTDEMEESSGLEAKCQVYRQPATPPASPVTSTPVLLSGNQENEVPRSGGLARALENVLKDARLAE
jgi:chaperone BCS1